MLVLNCVLDGMEAKPTHAKWAAMGKCFEDMALRDTNDLLACGVCCAGSAAGGRNTRVLFSQKGL